MQALNLPPCEFNYKEIEGKLCFFDSFRKKYIVLTPEEWVRQHFIHFLTSQYKYPKSLIKIESGHTYNQLSKRSDILVYDRYGKVFLLVECKSFDVPITQKTFEQAAIYNLTFKSQYLAVTNGMQHYICKIDHKTKGITFLKDFPLME